MKLAPLVTATKCLINYHNNRPYYERELFLELAKRYTRSVSAAMGSAELYVPTRDPYVGRSVFLWQSWSDAHDIEDVLSILDQLNVPDGRGKIFVDIGANIGTASISAILEHGFRRAIAFEPEEDNYKYLRINIIANNLEPEIATCQIALSNREGFVRMARSSTNPGNHRVVTASSGDDSDTVAVPARAFDAVVAEGLLDVSDLGLVWIDAEGHEGHVLAGAASLTSTPVPVFMEYWQRGLEESCGLSMLEEIIREKYAYILDMKAYRKCGRLNLEKSSSIVDLRTRYPGDVQTDLLLLK